MTYGQWTTLLVLLFVPLWIFASELDYRDNCHHPDESRPLSYLVGFVRMVTLFMIAGAVAVTIKMTV